MNRLLPLVGLLAVFALASAGFSPSPRQAPPALPTAIAAPPPDALPVVKYFARPAADSEGRVHQYFREVPLPSHVVAPAGRFTVFADYERAGEQGVPIYIVNRTSEVRSVSDQDGDMYLKLECESAPGVWTRAQSHQYSFCGNSYGSTWLPPGQFVVTTGYRRTTGKAAKVRYRFYSGRAPGESSNVGDGLVTLGDIQAAATDDMAIRHGSFDFVRRMALGEIVDKSESRCRALRQLAHNKTDSAFEIRVVLHKLAHDPDERVAREAREQVKFAR